jgi:hypothetical protein
LATGQNTAVEFGDRAAHNIVETFGSWLDLGPSTSCFRTMYPRMSN